MKFIIQTEPGDTLKDVTTMAVSLSRHEWLPVYFTLHGTTMVVQPEDDALEVAQRFWEWREQKSVMFP